MRGDRGEPVEVWLLDDRPARFVWRGRMYTVMFVLDRRIASPEPPTGPPPIVPLPAGPPPETGAGWECWRLEATPERTLPPATYELCHDLAADRWSLSRD